MRRRTTAIVVLVIGFIGFLNVARNPRFSTFHSVDVLQLLASGMCFGVALMGLLGRLKARA